MRLGAREAALLLYIDSCCGKIAAHHAALTDIRQIRSLLSKGLLQGDEVPAKIIRLTDAGKAKVAFLRERKP